MDVIDRILSVVDTLNGWCKNFFMVFAFIAFLSGWGIAVLNATANFVILLFAYEMVMFIIVIIKKLFVEYEWDAIYIIDTILELIVLIAFTIIFFVVKSRLDISNTPDILTWLAICIVAKGIIFDVVTLPTSLIGIFRDN